MLYSRRCKVDFSQIRQHAVQETLQSRIAGALGQLSQATQILNESQDLEYTNQIDDLLEDIVRQQNDIADKHEAWADINGDISKTVRLGITEGVTKAATARCVPHITRYAGPWLIVPWPLPSCAFAFEVPLFEPFVAHTSTT